MKNESVSSDKIDIMEDIQERYVPSCTQFNGEKEILQQAFFGGDNLTEERARNLQGTMAEGNTDYDHLEGLITWRGL